MKVYRATRYPGARFDPLDARSSVARAGWRFNDRQTAILYAASVQSLAILEIVARPGWERVKEIAIFEIEVPDGSVFALHDLGITLPTNWNNRPAASTAQRIGAEFLRAVDEAARRDSPLCGVRVPSVISTVDANILLDPRQQSSYRVVRQDRIGFDWLAATGT